MILYLMAICQAGLGTYYCFIGTGEGINGKHKGNPGKKSQEKPPEA
jgi:hypothetical protein